MIPVVLSGGSGTRLWPVSRQKLPKQFCEIFDKPLQTMTLQRAQRLGSPWIITSEALRTLTELNLQGLGMQDVTVLYEPYGKNTAPAIAALCRMAELRGQMDEVISVLPSDHLIQNENEFLKIVAAAEKIAEQNKIVTIGLKPTYPETGYGYIQTLSQTSEEKAHQAYPVQRFHEKPALAKAQEFIRQGGFIGTREFLFSKFRA